MGAKQIEYEYAIDIICGNVAAEDVPVMFREKAQALAEAPAQLLEYAQNKKWEEIKALRDSKETAGCPFKDRVIDSDERSVTKINTAVQAAQIYGEDFSIDWTMQDNSVMTLNYTEMLSVPLALAEWSNYLHQKARKIKEQIYAENDIAAIMAIGWDKE